MKNTTANNYSIELIDDHYWGLGWKQVQTFVVTHPEKESRIIYLWIKDKYNTAFTDITHFLDYMGVYTLDEHEELKRYDFEDSFDYNGPQDPFYDFIVSIVEGTYDMWIETAYEGRYILSED